MRSTVKIFVAMISFGAPFESSAFSDFYPCVIRPIDEIELSSVLSGVVDEVLVAPGERVKKGQLLVKLDSDLAQADFELAQARALLDGEIENAKAILESATQKFEIMRKGHQRKIVSDIEYTAARAEFKSAEIGLKRAVENRDILALEADRARVILDKASILSPVDGVIGGDIVGPGEEVGNDPIANILVTDKLRIESFVPTPELGQLFEKTTYEIEAIGFGSDRHQVEYLFSSPEAEVSSNITRVYFQLASSELIPGVQCQLFASS